jgi:uncharacterized cupin superfamily protein
MIKENDMSFTLRESIHEGSGKATVKSFFHDRLELKIFFHNTVLRPGVSIGFHKHKGSEEIYYIISGKGLMRVDDETSEVGPGDAVLTKNGSSHGLENIGETDLRIIVVGGNV